MSSTAIILARAGSKGVQNKNKLPFGKDNILSRAVKTLKRVKGIKKIIVSSNDDEILSIADLLEVTPFRRSSKFAKDQSTSEDAIFEVIQNEECEEIITLVQCTSPFINHRDIQIGIETLRKSSSNSSAHSVRSFDKFIWKKNSVSAINLIESSKKVRKPRQISEKEVFLEDGAFYIFYKTNFLKTKNRFSTRVSLIEHNSISEIEIDDYDDLEKAYKLQEKEKHKINTLKNIKLLVTDFDGVHTSGKVSFVKGEKEKVEVSRVDGKGIQNLKEKGIEVIILTAEKGGPAIERAKKLSIEIYDNSKSKVVDLNKIVKEKKLKLSNVAYLGDDDADLLPMTLVGYAAAPSNANKKIKKVSHFVSDLEGGNGFIREISNIFCQKNN